MAFVITADLLLPGPDGEEVPDGAVLVAGERIVASGPRRDVLTAAGPGVPVDDRPGRTLLPGLVDAHVHLVFDAGPDPVGALAATSDDDLLAAMAERALTLLDCGVTTARDLGDRSGIAIRLRDLIGSGAVPGPRLLAAGPPLTPAGGHCWFLGGAVAGPDDLRAAVRRTAAAGADLIKIMVTGGNLTPAGPPTWETQFRPAEIAAVVAEAHRLGRPVAAHVHGGDGVAAALEAGADTLEHCSFLPSRPGAAGPAAPAGLIGAIAARGVAVCPTLSAVITRNRRLAGEERLRPWLDLIRHEHESGVRLVAGTDAGIPHSPWDGYLEGLRWFERAGIPRGQVLEIATTRAAEALGLGHRTGRVVPGADADLLVVEGDPREDLAVLGAPELVVVRGRAHVPGRRPIPPLSVRSNDA
ncbi:amidohydrolase family protein [Spirillospora sp. NPDC048832]